LGKFTCQAILPLRFRYSVADVEMGEIPIISWIFWSHNQVFLNGADQLAYMRKFMPVEIRPPGELVA
jgi:hypothetical protein